MLYSVEHTTKYQYHEQVSLCHNIAALAPRNTDKQTCRAFNIVISPLPEVLEEHIDFFGNKLYYFVIEQEHEELTVTVRSQVEKTNRMGNQPSYPLQGWENVRDMLLASTGECMDEKQFTHPTEITTATDEIKDYAEKSFPIDRPLFEAVYDLIKRIYTDFTFTPGFTTISTPLSVVMKERKGVCQDFAHLAISGIHSMGLPARYVSGYLETVAPEGKVKLTGVDASHAWISVFIPGMGWVDFDPTNNQLADEQYITIGWGRDYFDIIPLKGVIMSSSPHELTVSVDVKRIEE
ncbi:MAG: transglutaminase family protein [Chitinophagaceae bacterium]|nr:transglutaminase family protein [Chitinophagaceae bacterium]